MQKARRGVRPGFLHNLFGLSFLARVAIQSNQNFYIAYASRSDLGS
jgi:hypothetical protein